MIVLTTYQLLHLLGATSSSSLRLAVYCIVLYLNYTDIRVNKYLLLVQVLWLFRTEDIFVSFIYKVT